jgi:hypothetical protein
VSRIGRAYLRLQWRLLVNALNQNLAGRSVGVLLLVMLLFFAAAPWLMPAFSPDRMTKIASNEQGLKVMMAMCWFFSLIIVGSALFETRQMTHLRHHMAFPLTSTDLFRLLVLYIQICLVSIILIGVPLVGRAYYAASDSVAAALFGAAVFLAAIECAFIGCVAIWSAILTIIRRPVWLLPVAALAAAIFTWPTTALKFEPLHLASAAMLDGDAWALAGFLAEFVAIMLLARIMYARGFLVHGLALVDTLATRAAGTGTARSRPLPPWRAAMRDELRIHTRSIRLLLIGGLWLACGVIVPIIMAGIDGEMDATFFALFPPIGAAVFLFAVTPLLFFGVATGGAEWKGDRRETLRILPIRFGVVLTGWAAAGSFLVTLPYAGGAAILVILAGHQPEFAGEPWATYAILFTPAVAMSGAAAAICREAVPAGTVSKVSLTGLSLAIVFAAAASATIAIAAWLAVYGGLAGAADYALTILTWGLILVLMGWIARLE